jgi:hypothetical protein
MWQLLAPISQRTTIASLGVLANSTFITTKETEMKTLFFRQRVSRGLTVRILRAEAAGDFPRAYFWHLRRFWRLACF